MSHLHNGPAESPDQSGGQPPDRIGHYTILKTLGEGGIGVVYLAEQSEPVKRQVALKDALRRVVRGSHLLAVLRGHEDIVWHAAFSPDGERVVTASWDNTARLWFVHLSDLLELAESRLPVTLTPEERARMLER
jgi:WD40 repeat protein